MLSTQAWFDFPFLILLPIPISLEVRVAPQLNSFKNRPHESHRVLSLKAAALKFGGMNLEFNFSDKQSLHFLKQMQSKMSLPGQSRSQTSCSHYQLFTRVASVIPRCEVILYIGMNFCTRELNFVPRNEILYMGMNFCTWAWHYVPGHDIMYLGMTLCTWAWHHVPGYDILYLGMTFCTWVWHFAPGN
jgi:hypothetical protein